MNKKLKKVFPVLCLILLCICIPMKVSAATVSAVDTDGTQRVFQLSMTQPGVSNMAQAYFAVWGDLNDQDDLKWYQAQLMSDGSYRCNVSVADHGQTGGYTVHAYAEGNDGSMTFLGNTAFQVSQMTQAGVSARGVTTANYNASAGTFQVWLQGIQTASGVSQVQFPVWCSADQSDIRWYDAARMSDGSYMAEVSTANHGGHSGTYQIHAYVRENNGAFTCVGGTTQAVNAAAVSTGSLSISERDGGASYQMDMSGVQISGLRTVQFAVWADQGGQDDLRWYAGSRTSSGRYTYTVPVSNHGQTGTYNVHAYAELSDGSMQFLEGKTFNVASAGNASNASAKVQVTNINSNTGAFDITVTNVSVPGGVRSVQVPVWHAADQSDIRWYDAQSKGNGTYTVSANVANHGSQTGNYNIHVYVTSNSGVMSFACGTAADIKAGTSSGGDAKVQVTNVNESVGTFDIVVSGVNAPGGVRSVQVPVWHSADQSDIKWYDAQSKGNGTYTVSASIANHNHNTGSYNIHVYATSNSGAMNFVCGTTVNIKGGSKPEAQSEVQASRVSDSQYRISLSAPNVGGSTSKVLFPTWSVENGQDDIIWYEGVRSSTGVWYADVDGRRHNSTGRYTTHAYIQANGQNTFAGAVEYTMNFEIQSNATRVANDANAIIGSITNSSMDSGTKLRTCYNWVVGNISYQTLSSLPPEAGYTQEEWYAIYGMEQRRGNCYCYAAAFAAMARQLGYNATMVSGSVPLLAGGWGPHAWVEIYMNGATYICDPESQYENPAYGFYMTTYATAPYVYRK